MEKKYKTYIKACESQIGRYAEQYNNKETLTKNTTTRYHHNKR